MFRQGFLAMCKIHAESKDALISYQQWEEALRMALGSSDRERDQVTVYPTEGIFSGGYYGYGQPLGPAMPFWPGF